MYIVVTLVKTRKHKERKEGDQPPQVSERRESLIQMGWPVINTFPGIFGCHRSYTVYCADLGMKCQISTVIATFISPIQVWRRELRWILGSFAHVLQALCGPDRHRQARELPSIACLLYRVQPGTGVVTAEPDHALSLNQRGLRLIRRVVTM